MREDFIKQYGLEFFEATENSDPFWGGVGTFNNSKYELYFRADGNGPTPVQLARFEKLMQGADEICEAITNKVRERLMFQNPGRWEKFRDAVVEFEIVGFHQDNEFVQIEILGSLRRANGFLRRRERWNAKIRDNRLTELE